MQHGLDTPNSVQSPQDNFFSGDISSNDRADRSDEKEDERVEDEYEDDDVFGEKNDNSSAHSSEEEDDEGYGMFEPSSEPSLYRVGFVKGELHVSRVSGVNSLGANLGPPAVAMLIAEGVFILDCYTEVLAIYVCEYKE
jgi:hypothetical protein